jgi:hypothetical protein
MAPHRCRTTLRVEHSASARARRLISGAASTSSTAKFRAQCRSRGAFVVLEVVLEHVQRSAACRENSLDGLHPSSVTCTSVTRLSPGERTRCTSRTSSRLEANREARPRGTSRRTARSLTVRVRDGSPASWTRAWKASGSTPGQLASVFDRVEKGAHVVVGPRRPGVQDVVVDAHDSGLQSGK